MAFRFRFGQKAAQSGSKQNRVQPFSKEVSPTEETSAGFESFGSSTSNKPKSPRTVGFKDTTVYEVILEYDLALINRPFRFQRLSMKSWTDFGEAVQDITRFVQMLNNISGNLPKGTQVVRIAAIYEASAFKDWSEDPYNLYDKKRLNQHIQDAIAIGKAPSNVKKGKPITYLKEANMKVR